MFQRYLRGKSALSLKHPTNLLLNKSLFMKKLDEIKSLPSINIQADVVKNSETTSPNSKTPISDPIIDPDLPSICTTLPARFSTPRNNIQIEDVLELRSLPKPDDPNFDVIFKRKCEMCSLECDYSNIDADVGLKEAIFSALKEMVVFFGQPYCKIIKQDSLRVVKNMLSFNIFRELPSIDTRFLPFDSPPVYVDNSFDRLDLCYFILRLLILNFPFDEVFPTSFTKKLISMLKSPNIQEHGCITQCVMQYYTAFSNRHNDIINELFLLIQNYRDKINTPFCVWPSLVLIFRIFKPQVTQLDKKYVKMIYETIIPLALTSHLSWFWEPLQNVFSLSLYFVSHSTYNLLFYLIHHFPKTAIFKQVAYLKIMMKLCEYLNLNEFGMIVYPLFNIFAECSMSQNVSVIETAFKLWSNQKIVPYIVEKSKIVFPIMYPPIAEVSKSYWSCNVQNTAITILAKMHDIDPFVYDELKTRHVKAGLQKQKLNQQKNWALIARNAARRDRNFDLFTKLSEIQYVFNSETPQVIMSATRGTNEMVKQKVISPTMKKNIAWR